MYWYLLKTWMGKEEELRKEIHRTIPSYLYKECFVIYQERIWRKQQRSIVHVEPLFPGCVFLTCENRGSIYESSNQISAIERLLVCSGSEIFPVMEEDAEFLQKISGKDHMVKLSSVIQDDQGQIRQISGPLKICMRQMKRCQLKKRYAIVHRRLWGEDQVIVLGIRLKEDIDRKLLYGERRILAEASEQEGTVNSPY